MIPLIVAAAGAAIQMGGAISKSIKGAKRAKEAQKALDNYERQTLENVVRGKVGVSRLGADLQAQEQSRLMASSLDALQSGGVRSVVGGLGRVQAQNNFAQRQIASDLDRQKQDINKMIVQDDQRIRQMQETREQQDLAGLGRELNAGRQDANSGIAEAGQALSSLGGMMGMSDMGQGTQKPQVQSVTAGTNLGQVQAFGNSNVMAGQGQGVANTTTAYNAYQPNFANPMLGQGMGLMPS